MKPLWPLSALAFLSVTTSFAADYLVYFGTHTSGPDKGFSVAHFDSDTGALSKPEFLTAADGPAFFIISADGRHLYTCNTLGSRTEGRVSAYAIDPKTGKLTLLNSQPSGGADPSYISLDQTGRYAFVANYNGGNLAVFPVKPDGSLGERTALDQHTGTSVTPDRAKQAYAHSIITDPSNRFVLCTDLGLDRTYIYKFDDKTGRLTPNDPPFFADKPGSGPRHVIFSPDGKFVYVIHEVANTISVYAWDAEKGSPKELQNISTLPADFKGTSTCAEIVERPDGKFLYATNRGHNSLAVFAVNPETGLLTFVETVPTQGNTPRNFALDPASKWLLVTNHGSNNAVVFRVDQASGKLTPAGEPVSIPYPFCERFFVLPDNTAPTTSIPTTNKP